MASKWIGLAGAALALTGCGVEVMNQTSGPKVVGSGKVTTLHQSVGNFSTVEFDGAFDSSIKVGKAGDLTIEGDDNIVPLVKTKIENGTLRVYVDRTYSTKHTLKVTLDASVLRGVSVNGSGDMRVNGVNDKRFAVAINGSGSAVVEGSADSLTAAVNGSGKMNLAGLKSRTAEVAIHGSGDVKVAVSDSLTASIAGSGSIHYSGKPKVTKSIAGVGEIRAD